MGHNESILVVRSTEEASLALALEDLSGRFPGVPVVLLSDPDLSPATLACFSNLQLERYSNLRRFFLSQLGELRRPIYQAKVVFLVRSNREARFKKFEGLFLLFRARQALVYDDAGEISDVSLRNWRTNRALSIYGMIVSHGLAFVLGETGRALLTICFRIIAMPLVAARLTFYLALIFSRKWYFSIAYKREDQHR